MSGICEVAILVGGRERARFQSSSERLVELGGIIAEHWTDLETEARVAVVVTTPDLIRHIVARSR